MAVLRDPADLPSRPPPGTLHLWCGVPEPGSLDRLLSFLTHAEHEEVARYRDAADRLCVAAARAAARVQLGAVLGCPPDRVGLIRGLHGKPALDPVRHGTAAERVHFNVSHARGLVAVALSGSRTGIDVEPARAVPDMAAVARAVFAPEMLAAFEATTGEDERLALFYRFWTLGEAFIKATGEGVAQGLTSFAFNAHGPPRLIRVAPSWGPAERWRFGVWDAAASVQKPPAISRHPPAWARRGRGA